MERHKKRTREIYQKQHQSIANDKKTFDRIFGIYKGQTYGLGNSFFKNKIALDAGCGNFGALTARLSNLGCDKIYACDLGKSWIKPMKKSLTNRKINLRNIYFQNGDVTKLKYKTNMFDFVAFNGVLPHLKNKVEIKKAFKEGSRVTKKGGYFFTSFGVSGGLIQSVILPAIRKHYKKNKEFKKFLDNVKVNDLKNIFNFISLKSKKNNGPYISSNFLTKLFHQDFIVFLRNHIQAPTWLTNECDLEFINSLYKKNGFKRINRIKKFVKRTDVRKYFAPLHFMRDHWFSKILYGQGYMQFIAQKK
jgi:ubiquinone/menaquinone biosynthesis C-methylase UbiE